MPAEVTITMKPHGFLKKRIRYTLSSSAPQETLLLQKDLLMTLDKPIRVKKVRIHVKNPGKCPTWHPGAGSPTWVFIDEIRIM
jgi:hypothetical protein